jgi:predicted dehydrogenase
MTDPVGVGVIGAGYWGRKLIGEYLASERNTGNVRLFKICDASLAALLECKRKFSIEDDRLSRDFKDVIENPKISAVHIATPNPTHYPLAKMALEAGKDVLVEKPMTLKSSEAYELVDLADSQKRVLRVGHIFRYNAALRSARQLLRRGSLGKIFYVRVQWTDSVYFPDRDIIFDLGPHPIDVLNQLLDAWPEQVSALSKVYRDSKHHEVAYVIAEFQNDVFAQIELSWLHPTKTREAIVIGSEETLIVDCLRQHLTRVHNGNIVDISVPVNNTIESEITSFVTSVARRSVSRESGLLGARTVEVLEAIRESMRERPVPLPRRFGDDHTSALVAVLETVSNGVNGRVTEIQRDGDRDTRRYLELLVKQGLVRGAVTKEGLTYEVTETGSQFLKECRDIARGLEWTFGRSHPRGSEARANVSSSGTQS